MAREKATVTLDRAKVRSAMTLIGGASMSEVIDVALDRLIHVERLRHDIAAYSKHPPSADEIALTEMSLRLDLGDDDVDYEALYGTGLWPRR